MPWCQLLSDQSVARMVDHLALDVEWLCAQKGWCGLAATPATSVPWSPGRLPVKNKGRAAVRLWRQCPAQMAQWAMNLVIKAIPPLDRSHGVGMRWRRVRSNCALSIGQLCRELPLMWFTTPALYALIGNLCEE